MAGWLQMLVIGEPWPEGNAFGRIRTPGQCMIPSCNME